MVSEAPKISLSLNIKGIINVVDFPAELNGISLLLKTTYIEHGEIKPALTLKPRPYWLAFIVLCTLLEEKTKHQS